MQCFWTYLFERSSSSSLLNTLRKLKPPKSNSVLLFSLSTNVSDLENIVSYLSKSAAQSIGCLCAPISLSSDTATCSVGYLNSKDCIPFRSTIPGKPSVQVGRWLTGSKNPSVLKGFEGRLPDFSQNVSSWANTQEPRLLPEALSNLDTRDLNSVIYFTDKAPEGLIGALSQIPNVKQLGVFASSTPFITGLPVTLFYNGERFSSGAVGVALKNTYGTSLTSIDYPRLLPFFESMKIDRIDGNLIHILDDLNPTKLLLEAIAVNNDLLVDKEDSLFLGHPLSSLSENPLPKIYRIAAGGQSRGILALEGDASFKSGDLVQFYALEPLVTKPAPATLLPGYIDLMCTDEDKVTFSPHVNTSFGHTLSLLSGSINFICTDEDRVASSPPESTSFDDFRTLDNLSIASENGFLVSNMSDSTELPFRCTVPGSVAHATLNIKE